jgi:4-hydroxybenzoyl-CoA reductase subunit beta
MLRLPRFEHHAPESAAAAATLLAELNERGESARLIAGGTDLLPNMKHEIVTPVHLVSLHRVGLRGVALEGDAVRLGAMTTIQTVADHPIVREKLPALAEACAQIAGPQLRRMGTIGGNVCLDTRCVYVNQTHFWRSALGFCLKKDGSVCHVVAGGRRCVAAAANDSALPLLAYGARLTLLSVRGERRLPIERFYQSDGANNRRLGPNEILTEIRIPVPGPRVDAAFEKLRVRKSIDFPLLNLAAIVERNAGGELVRLDLFVSARGSKPKHLSLGAALLGAALDDDTIAEAARRAHDACKPLTNISMDPGWRRAMVAVLARRALRRLAACGPETPGETSAGHRAT